MAKPPNYWNNNENVKKEINRLMKNLGHFPTAKELQKIGKSDLYNAVRKYHSGLGNAKLYMNYKNLKQNYNKTKKELDKLISEPLCIPTFDELREAGDYQTIYKVEGLYHDIKNLKDSIKKYGKSKKKS